MAEKQFWVMKAPATEAGINKTGQIPATVQGNLASMTFYITSDDGDTAVDLDGYTITGKVDINQLGTTVENLTGTFAVNSGGAGGEDTVTYTPSSDDVDTNGTHGVYLSATHPSSESEDFNCFVGTWEIDNDPSLFGSGGSGVGSDSLLTRSVNLVSSSNVAHYTTLRAAMQAAVSGDTIHVLQDTTETANVDFVAGVIVYLHGHTVTTGNNQIRMTVTGTSVLDGGGGTVECGTGMIRSGSGVGDVKMTWRNIIVNSSSTTHALNAAAGTTIVDGCEITNTVGDGISILGGSTDLTVKGSSNVEATATGKSAVVTANGGGTFRVHGNAFFRSTDGDGFNIGSNPIAITFELYGAHFRGGTNGYGINNLSGDSNNTISDCGGSASGALGATNGTTLTTSC